MGPGSLHRRSCMRHLHRWSCMRRLRRLRCWRLRWRRLRCLRLRCLRLRWRRLRCLRLRCLRLRCLRLRCLRLRCLRLRCLRLRCLRLRWRLVIAEQRCPIARILQRCGFVPRHRKRAALGDQLLGILLADRRRRRVSTGSRGGSRGRASKRRRWLLRPLGLSPRARRRREWARAVLVGV